MPSTRSPCAPCAPREVPVAPEATLQGGVPDREWQETHRLSSVGVEIDARSCAVLGEPWGSWHTTHVIRNAVAGVTAPFSLKFPVTPNLTVSAVCPSDRKSTRLNSS